MLQAKFSANTGYLWRELPFVERIKKAAEFGFDAVEFHDEAQRGDLSEISSVLEHYNLPVVSLNTFMGTGFGSAALSGQEDKTKKDVDVAIETAERLGASAVHVLSGCADGDRALEVYISNLLFALDRTDKVILIEPISEVAVPGYFMKDINLAVRIIEEVSNPRLKILFDCFHIRNSFSDLGKIFDKHYKHVNHVQISSFPARNEPFDGEITYSELIPMMIKAGYGGFFGCEYNPESTMESGINWRETFTS
ncbi:MAG: TIM barrel protein [Pseudomonadota bacterium]